MDKLQRNLLIIFSLAMLVVIAFAVYSVRNGLNEYENNRLSLESRERLLLLGSLERALLEAESSQRAYAASGHDLFLEEHGLQRWEVSDYLEQLQATIFPATSDIALVEQLGQLINERTAIMDELTATRREQGAEDAAQLIAGQQGKRIMDKIRTVAQQLSTEELGRLNLRHGQARSHNRQFMFLLVSGTLFNFLLLLGAYVIIRRELKRNKNLLQLLRCSSEEIKQVNELSSTLQSCESREDAAAVLRHFMALLFPGITGGLYLMRPSRNLLELSANWGSADSALIDPISPSDCWALRSGRTHSTCAQGKVLRCAHLAHDCHASLCIPLVAQSEIVGMLHMELADQQQLSGVQERAELLAIHLSAAIAGIILREALHQQSIRDPLTNLYNRRYLEESMERELLRAKRNRQSLGVIMLDIDHFKKFNDNYGHQAGDLLLKEFARYLGSHVRGEDIPCRYGGEEFFLLLPGASLENCRERAESLRCNMASLKLEFQGQQLPVVTASFGIAAFPDHCDEWEKLIRLADAALYHAKHHGRDRVSSADDLNAYQGAAPPED
ncbi:MAG: diguanylate cyclase [Porticoccaceae bacterium]|nr:diguanylate cyclase [Porticoccaceae bacterium]